VKKVKVALCMLEIATGFNPREPEVLEARGNTQERKGKVTVEKSKTGGRTPLFCGKPPKSPSGRSRPLAQRLVLFLFPTVTKTLDEERLLIDSCQ